VIAHLSGVPVEELLPLAYAAGSVWLLLSRPGQLAGRLVHHLRNR